MTMRFKPWEHPRTGEIRVYVQDVPMAWSDTKIWLEQIPEDSFGYTWNIRAKSPSQNRSELNNLINDVEKEIINRTGKKLKGFGELLKALKIKVV